MKNTPRFRQLQTSTDSRIEKLGLGIFLYAYAVLLGASYLFAFWRAIGFNIFPYLSLQDYLSAPLNRIVVLVAAPALFSLVIFRQKISSYFKGYQDISLYLIFLYAIAFLIEYYKSVSIFIQHDFSFPNERTVLALASILFLASMGLTFHIYRTLTSLSIQALALILIQTAIAMSAGYHDGKTIYTGAVQVYFLDNKEVCETGGVRDWVYLGKYTDHTLFLNTIDKRLCLSGEKNFKLVSRKFSEKL